MLEKVREYAHAAMVDSEDVTARLRQTVEDAERERLEKASAELKKNEARLASLMEMVSKLYEDRMMGRISEENFSMLMAKAQTEQEEAKARIRLLQQEQQHRNQSTF